MNLFMFFTFISNFIFIINSVLRFKLKMKKFLCILFICSKIVQLNCTGKDKRKLGEYLEHNPSTSNEFSQKSIKKSKPFDLNKLPADDEFDSFNDENFQYSLSAQQNPMYNIQQSTAESSSNPTVDDHIIQSHIEPNMIVNPPPMPIEQDYVDREGNSWAFNANIGKNNIREKLLTEFGFTIRKENINTLNLRCKKKNPADGKCPMRGIYLKSNGYLYTRGKHEHSEKGKTPQNFGDNYVDQHGKVWSFHEEIGKDSPIEILRNKFGFIIRKENTNTLNLRCQKKNHGCPFKGIYLKENGCLYTQEKHEHKHN